MPLHLQPTLKQRGPSEWLRRAGLGSRNPNYSSFPIWIWVCFSASQMTHTWHTLKMSSGLREAWKTERQALSSSMDKSSTGLLCFWQGRKGKFLYLMVLLLFLVGQFLLSRNSKYRSIILNSLHCAKEQYFWYKITKCTVPEQQTSIPCPGIYWLSFQCTVESMNGSRGSERFGKGYKAPQRPWKCRHELAWCHGWVVCPGFPSNCVQTPSCWMFSISTQSSVPQPCSSLCLLQKRWELTQAGAESCAWSHILGRRVCWWYEATFFSTGIFLSQSCDLQKVEGLSFLFSYQAGVVLSR